MARNRVNNNFLSHHRHPATLLSLSSFSNQVLKNNTNEFVYQNLFFKIKRDLNCIHGVILKD